MGHSDTEVEVGVWHVVYFDAILGRDLISRAAEDAKEAHDHARSLEHQGHAVVDVLELPEGAARSTAYQEALRAVAALPPDKIRRPSIHPRLRRRQPSGGLDHG